MSSGWGFVGQRRIISRMRMWLYVADERPNVLLRGPYGSGKTTLAHWYAGSIDPEYYYHACGREDCYPPEGDRPVVLDEIHNLRPEEAWYDYRGVLIGCTTEGAPVSPPLRSRCVELWMEPYSQDELRLIIQLATGLSVVGAQAIATRSRDTPRTAIMVAREVKTLCKYYNYEPDKAEEYNRLLDSLGIFSGGFTGNDYRYLELLKNLRVASLDTLAKTLNLPKTTISEEIEPFLLRQNKIGITSRGRCINVLES